MRRFAVTLALLPAALGLAVAQPAAPPDSTFFESVDVEVVNVEVVVTDRQGRRVPGLSKEDFQLFEDGRPVEITNFYAADGADEGTPAGLPSASPPAGEAQRLYLAVFVDNLSLTPGARRRAIESLKSFAGGLGADDRVVLATFDGSLDVRQLPTNDPGVLATALDELGASTALAGFDAIEQRRIAQEIERARAAPPERRRLLRDSAYEEIRAYEDERVARVRRTIEAVGQLTDSLAGLPGRKALLFVTGGMAMRPGEALHLTFQAAFGDQESPLEPFRVDASPLLQRLLDRANANRVTFYILGATDDSGSTPAESDGSLAREHQIIAEMSRAQPLLALADATGGLAAVTGSAGRSLLDRMSDDFDAFYSLGYAPTRRDAGRRRLEVKVEDRSLTVRHREAFRPTTLAEQMGARALSALVLGEVENPLGVTIEVEGEERQGRSFVVTLLVKLPLSKLALLPQGEVAEGRARFWVGARDEEGRTSELTEVALPFRVPTERLAAIGGETAATRVRLRLRPGPHVIAVAMRDEVAGLEATAVGRYTVGGLAPAKGKRR